MLFSRIFTCYVVFKQNEKIDFFKKEKITQFQSNSFLYQNRSEFLKFVDLKGQKDYALWNLLHLKWH